jgi:hypothetical protein
MAMRYARAGLIFAAVLLAVWALFSMLTLWGVGYR